MTTAPHRRYHSLDQLRAVMMVLGLVLHSAVSYTEKPLGDGWPYHDANNHLFFSLLTTFIHLFRMPLFFLMAGFFAAYLYYRHGAIEMLRNRTLRVALPFIVFLPLIFPAAMSGFAFASAGGIDGGWASAAAYLAAPADWYEGLRTLHLWFLYYLSLIYVLILLTVPPFEHLARAWIARTAQLLGRYIHHPLAWIGCSAVTFLTLLPMAHPGLDTETEFRIRPKILLAYGVFVLFGWLLYMNREQVDRFARRAWPFTAIGAFIAAGYLTMRFTDELRGHLLLTRVVAALAIWALIYGFVGLFVRYYDRPNPYGRYLADTSYWLYLVHLPLTIWMAGLLGRFDLSPFVKFGITLAVTTLVTVASYHLFVRSTAIGVFLNGRRHPRTLPRVEDLGRA